MWKLMIKILKEWTGNETLGPVVFDEVKQNEFDDLRIMKKTLHLAVEEI